MKIKKITLINWGVVPNGEYPFDDLSGITGETGVGKSSLGDAIQTIMGAALDNIITYNAGQDESQNKKRNKEYRTLPGYIAGEDRYAFARPESCSGTVALTFQSSGQEDAGVFTAILNTSVSFEIKKGVKTPKVEELRFFILKENEVFLEELSDHSGRILVFNMLHSYLSSTYGKEKVIEYKGKEDFLNGLYGHLWGKDTTSSIHAKRAAKSFCNFINARPVDDINSFVRNEFLEPRDMRGRIDDLSSSLRALDRIEKEAKDTEDGIKVLDSLVSKTNNVLVKWYENKEKHFIRSALDLTYQDKKNEEAERQFAKDSKNLRSLEKSEIDTKRKLDDIREKRLKAEAEAMGNKSYQDKKSLEQELLKHSARFSSIKNGSLLQCINLLDGFKNELKGMVTGIDIIFIPHSILDELNNVITHISEASYFKYFTASDIEQSDMGTVLERMDELFSDLYSTLEFVSKNDKYILGTENTKKEEDSNFSYLKELSEKMDRVLYQITELENNKKSAPTYIQADFDILKNNLPDSKTDMLFTFVDIKPEHGDWRDALEGLLGNARFAVIVEERYEIEAISLAKAKNLNLKIIQGEKLLSAAKTTGQVPDSSIVHLLTFANATAEAYFLQTYGNVLMVDDYITLKKSNRGLMKDCSASSGNTMYNCRLKDGWYVFGAEGRKRTLERLGKDRTELSDKISYAESEKSSVRKTNAVIKSISSLLGQKEHHLHMVEDILDSYRYYKSVHERISQIDVSSIEDIDKKILQLKDAESTYASTYETKIKAIATTTVSLSSYEELKKERERERARRENIFDDCKMDYQNVYVSMHKDGRDFEEYSAKLLKKEADKENGFYPPKLKEDIVDTWHLFLSFYEGSSLRESPKVQMVFERSYEVFIDSDAVFDSLVSLKDKALSEKTFLENEIAFKNKEKLREANKNFEDLFINDFCNSIYVNIREGEGNINELNIVLDEHRFGDDRYCVKMLPPSPELKEYKLYFKEIHELRQISDDSSLYGPQYEGEYKSVTKKLIELIKDNEKRDTELIRLSDYRNYNNYEIIQTVGEKEIELSRNGKMSGGQGETSYYVIRSINLSAALKAKDMSGSSLKSVFMDESFSKSNETRSKEILQYLNKTLGFQVIFAMPTRNFGSFLNMNIGGYHFVKMPLVGEMNGELEYQTWVQKQELNTTEIQKLYEKEELKIMEDVKRDADAIYG